MKFKVGDYVQATDTSYSKSFTKGNYYEILEVKLHSLRLIDNDGDLNGLEKKYFKLAPWRNSPLWKVINSKEIE